MTSRIHTQNQPIKKETQDLSTTSVQGMFQPRPFVMEAQRANQVQQPGLKTSLIQAKHYGHHLNQIDCASVSKPEALQPKMEMGKPVQARRRRRGNTTARNQPANTQHRNPATATNQPANRQNNPSNFPFNFHQDLFGSSSLSSTERARRRVANADQPLDPVASRPKKATVGHGHAQHGHQTTDAEHIRRVNTGITPTGNAGRPPKQSSRFTSPQAEAEALGRGRRALNNDLKNGNVPHQGNGFVDPKTNMPVRHNVDVTTNRNGGFGVAAVKGQPSATMNNTPIKTARNVFEYVPSAKQWQPVTYYPN